jgi:hypothetical protein
MYPMEGASKLFVKKTWLVPSYSEGRNLVALILGKVLNSVMS